MANLYTILSEANPQELLDLEIGLFQEGAL